MCVYIFLIQTFTNMVDIICCDWYVMKLVFVVKLNEIDLAHVNIYQQL